MASTRARVVEKIIALLKAESRILEYTGQRIYGSHVSTIQDIVYPAISIHIMPGPGRKTSEAFQDEIILQIEPWMPAVGGVEYSAYTWDDVMGVYASIVDTLHRNKFWDDTIGIKGFEMTQISKGPQITDPNGIMHFPSRWRINATI